MTRYFGGRGSRQLVRGYFFVLLSLVGCGIVVSGFLDIYFSYFESREQISRLQTEVATGAAFKIERFVQEIKETMRSATKSRDVVSAGLSPSYEFELRKLLLIATPVTEVVAIDQSGMTYSQVSRLRTILPEDRRNLSTTRAFREALQGEPYFSPIYFVQGSEPYMTIAIPIERFTGEIIGVLQAEVNLKYIRDLISSIKVGKTGYAYVVSRYGDLIAHPDISLVLKRLNLGQLPQVSKAFAVSTTRREHGDTMVTGNLQGEKVLSNHALIPFLDWGVFIEQAVEEAYQQLYRSLFRTLLLLLSGLGLTLLASIFMARKVIKPLETLRKGAELIGSGNLDYRFTIKTGDEIEVLAEEFNKMTDKLQEAYSNLEQKVKERTQKLVESNLNLEEARKDLEEWNKTLEKKVQKQVNDLERAGRIKRFVSPQVAETILNSDNADPFQTHRREVTVVFIDLRGFTNFSDSHEPEEVMQVLRKYHEEVGKLIFKYEGTLEHFSGDGIMIFFNDPLPREDHSELAARMAIDVQRRVNALRSEWHRRGYNLDVGIGISTGFATLGTIGFEGRMDYGAIGNVTIMASRLSSEAAGGQILTDKKTISKIEGLIKAEQIREMTLKGFARPVSVFNISGLK